MSSTAIVVDDDRDILDITSSLLELNGLTIVAKDVAGESALQHLRDYRPDLAVMDVFVPGGGGLELLDAIRREALHTRSILVTGYERESWLIQALELGVDGYLIKPHIPELIPAVRAVLTGQRVLCAWATGVLIRDYLRLRTQETGDGLTPRERDVLKYRAQGKSVKETAVGLDISPKTVEKHVTNLKKKIAAGNAMNLTAFPPRLGPFNRN
jgi:DNA-binding NarL/FixJ family response regulator